MYVYFLDQSRFQDVISNIISPFNDDSHNEQLLICFKIVGGIPTPFQRCK
jgi:hypothetical protein